jgi:chaperonin cofactor prefoldin
LNEEIEKRISIKQKDSKKIATKIMRIKTKIKNKFYI